MAGLTEAFVRAVRAALHLDEDPAEPPQINRLALRRVKIDKATSDGQSVDVTPEHASVKPHQNVPVRVGVPGLVAVVEAGAVALLGWERGNPASYFLAPIWEAGATVAKLVFNASAIHLGGESGSKEAARKGDKARVRLGTVTAVIGAVTVVTAVQVIVNGTPTTIATTAAGGTLVDVPIDEGSSIVFIK